jgi:hypothetical protein
MRKTHVIDGVTYVAVDREAKIGDKVLIVEAWGAHGKYDNGSVIEVQRLEDEGIENDMVSARNNETGFISTREYVVLEPLEAVDSPQVTDLLANLARRVSSLEQQLSATQANVEKLAEELANTKHRVSKHGAMFGIVEERVGMLTDDIVTLDERSQVLNAINKFYEEGRR